MDLSEIRSRVTLTTKACSGCGLDLPMEMFSTRRASVDGLAHQCKLCVRRYKQRHYADPRKRKDTNLRHCYGITVDQYEEILERQGGRCAGCGVTADHTLHVDHDHSCCPGSRACGKCVRGLLCVHCNVALGMAKDDPARLRGLADYIESVSAIWI